MIACSLAWIHRKGQGERDDPLSHVLFGVLSKATRDPGGYKQSPSSAEPEEIETPDSWESAAYCSPHPRWSHPQTGTIHLCHRKRAQAKRLKPERHQAQWK